MSMAAMEAPDYLRWKPLCAMGVEEFLLIGLCGVFGEGIQVGDVLLPEKIWMKKGVPHYVQNPGFAKVNSSEDAERLTLSFQQRGLAVRRRIPSLRTPCSARPIFKETLWQEMGCVGVDMEASAFCECLQLLWEEKHGAAVGSDSIPFAGKKSLPGNGRREVWELTERFVCAGITLCSCKPYHKAFLEGSP